MYTKSHSLLYCRRGKIRWAKRSRFQPHSSFRENTFTLPWPEVLIIVKRGAYIHGKTFAVLLKTTKTVKI